MINICIVGEAWGEAEERNKRPFVGPSGHELTRMLSAAGINRSDCYLTNVFNLRPRPNNAIASLCQAEKTYPYPPLARGKYLQTRYFPEVDRLLSEIRNLKPNIAILLGNTATWALVRGAGGIGKLRGYVVESNVIPGLKCLPTYHPAAVLREWSLRPTTILDLAKANRESSYPEVRRPSRIIYIEPSLTDLESFFEDHLRFAPEITFDIETAKDQITCIGFSPNPRVALVIPFFDPRKPSRSFWPSLQDEGKAWAFVRRVLALPCPKSAQNGLYDINFLWQAYGIIVNNFSDDTMLLHHALQPESEKGLGFLGSIYTDEISWKQMRSKGTIKQED